ncbi:MAG: TadE family protein [Actinomycetota bacterium]
MRRHDRGQATVEAALLLPVVAIAMLSVIQVGLLVHARVMVTHAAREGARVAATGGGSGAVVEAVAASGGLAPQRLDVDVVRDGSRVTVVVGFAAPTNVPIVGAFIGDLSLEGTATMRIER